MQALFAFGCRLLIASATLALGACASNTPPTSTNTVSAVRLGGDNTRSGSPNSVNAVSDALGQRLDNMLAGRQTNAAVTR